MYERRCAVRIDWRATVDSMRINPALSRLGPSPMTEIQDRARRLRDAGRPLVDFSIGDPREPTPAFIRSAFIEAVPRISQYPTTRGGHDVRAAVAGYLARRAGVEVDPDTQILATSGSKEAIFSTALAFVDPESRSSVVWPTPGYPVYDRGAALAGARSVPIRIDGDFVLRPDMIVPDEWERAALVWLCTPHNPAGSVTPPDVLGAFVATARSTGTLLCVDECYLDIYEGAAPTSVLELAGAGSEGVLSYLSLSKRSGMTGYRSGAIVGDPVAIRALASLRSATGTAPPEPTQAAAIAAWADDDHVAERRKIFASKRSVLRSAFEAAGIDVVGSEAGIYVWVRVADDVEAAARLLDAGVVVAPGSAFGAGGEGYLRLALVPPLDECRFAAEKVIECLNKS